MHNQPLHAVQKQIYRQLFWKYIDMESTDTCSPKSNAIILEIY